MPHGHGFASDGGQMVLMNAPVWRSSRGHGVFQHPVYLKPPNISRPPHSPHHPIKSNDPPTDHSPISGTLRPSLVFVSFERFRMGGRSQSKNLLSAWTNQNTARLFRGIELTLNGFWFGELWRRLIESRWLYMSVFFRIRDISLTPASKG